MRTLNAGNDAFYCDGCFRVSDWRTSYTFPRYRNHLFQIRCLFRVEETVELPPRAKGVY